MGGGLNCGSLALLECLSPFQITKDEFDSKAKYLMGENNIQLHNDFLFAMLVKCQTGGISPHPIGMCCLNAILV